MSDLKAENRELLKKLPELEGSKVLVFGDVGVDEYVQGDVLRISPEAPVPVVEVKTVDKKLGLSANVAANVRSLGGEPLLFSLVGPDANGENLRKRLKEQGISDRYLMVDPQRSTTTKLRVMSSHQHIVRVDFENRSSVNRELLFQHRDSLSDMVGQCDCVVIPGLWQRACG